MSRRRRSSTSKLAAVISFRSFSSVIEGGQPSFNKPGRSLRVHRRLPGGPLRWRGEGAAETERVHSERANNGPGGAQSATGVCRETKKSQIGTRGKKPPAVQEAGTARARQTAHLPTL